MGSWCITLISGHRVRVQCEEELICSFELAVPRSSFDQPVGCCLAVCLHPQITLSETRFAEARGCRLRSMRDEHFLIGQATHGGIHLSHDARRRHVAVFGKSGAGKTTFLANLAVHDLNRGAGLCVIDPHGDLAASLLDFIPKARTNATIYFNPNDRNHCVGLNLFADVPEAARPTAAAAVIAAFSHIFGLSPDTTPRLLHYLRFSVLALLDAPGMTLVHLPLMLTDARFRSQVLTHVNNPVVQRFWQIEFEQNSKRYNAEAMAPVLSRIQAFLVYPVIRNIIGQRTSTFDLRRAMDERLVIIANLAKGEIGEEASNLLGSLLVSNIQLAAMSRIDTPPEERADFGLIVDEFANFTTSSFASLLSEARKMNVNLTLAGQYRSQAPEEIFDAVAGNAGAMIVFRVGAPDAEYFSREFAPVSPEALTDLPAFQAYAKSFDRTGGRRVECRPYPKPSGQRAHLVINASRRGFTRPARKVARQVDDILRRVS